MATKLKKERESKQISQSQLAEILGVSKQTICDWEKGRHIPNYLKLKKLSNYFGKSIDYLLEQEVEEKPDNNPAIALQNQNNTKTDAEQ